MILSLQNFAYFIADTGAAATPCETLMSYFQIYRPSSQSSQSSFVSPMQSVTSVLLQGRSESKKKCDIDFDQSPRESSGCMRGQ